MKYRYKVFLNLIFCILLSLYAIIAMFMYSLAGLITIWFYFIFDIICFKKRINKKIEILACINVGCYLLFLTYLVQILFLIIKKEAFSLNSLILNSIIFIALGLIPTFLNIKIWINNKEPKTLTKINKGI